MSISITADGSHTVFSERFGEHYHSTNGALQESLHIFIEAGFNHQQGISPLKILEMGFGTGLNCFLTCVKSEELSIPVFFETLEAFPLEQKLTANLNYPEYFGSGRYENLFKRIHEVEWESTQPVTKNFTLLKRHISLIDFKPATRYNLVYFDAFSPHSQPELWTASVFTKLYDAMEAGSVLVTYSAKGEVKRNLRDVGFRVENLPGPPGKREMTRAIKS